MTTHGAPTDDETRAAGQVADLARTLDQLVRETTAPAPLPEPGSALAGDDQRLGHLQLSHLAWTSLSTAVEHLESVTRSIAGLRRIDPHVPYTLIRGGLEDAATAAWMLAPTARADRLTRSLRVAWTDVLESGNVEKLTGVGPRSGRSVAQRQTEIRRMATGLGLVEKDAAVPLTYRRMIREAAANTGLDPDFVEIVWRLCSGFAHGRRWASLAYLDREEHSREDGVVQMALTTSFAALVPPLTTAVRMAGVARQLYETRRRVLPLTDSCGSPAES